MLLVCPIKIKKHFVDVKFKVLHFFNILINDEYKRLLSKFQIALPNSPISFKIRVEVEWNIVQNREGCLLTYITFYPIVTTYRNIIVMSNVLE